MRNLLVFHLEVDFNLDIHIVANNEKDLQDYLTDNHNFTGIEFRDLDATYGTCSFKTQYGRETAKCFYLKYIN